MALLHRFLFVSFAICVLFAAGTAHGESVSVVRTTKELESFAVELRQALEQLNWYSDSRMAYFYRGLGWQDGPTHGFFDESRTVYFDYRWVGYTDHDQQGAKAGTVVVSYGDRLTWAALTRQSGEKLSVGYDGARAARLRWEREDGGVIESWDRSIRCTYPGGQWYMLVYDRRAPVLSFSPSFAAALLSSPSLLDDVESDFPHDYVIRILRSAVEVKVNLSDPRELSLHAINWFRGLAGIGDLEWDDRLHGAADSHANYLVRNGIIRQLMDQDNPDPNSHLGLHDERPGMSGFTGRTPQERSVASGWGESAGETATLSLGEVASEVVNWFHTVFHRRPYLDHRVLAVGHAHRGADGEPTNETTGVALWGREWSRSLPELVVYPAAGELLVPWAWTGREAPDPFPGRKTGVGVPISVAFTDPVFAGGKIELMTADGDAVPLLTTEVAADPAHFVEAVPADPLEPGTTYRASYSSGAGRHEWEFTTAPLNPAETAMQEIRRRLNFDVELRRPDFDIDDALAVNTRKGTIGEQRGEEGLRLTDSKYAFSVLVPPGWSQSERDWQEMALVAREYSTISLSLYTLFPGQTAVDVLATYGGSVKQSLVKETEVGSLVADGYRREHSWQYSGKVVCYFLRMGEYGLGIWGYGVEDEEIDGVFQSLLREESFNPSRNDG